MDGNRRKSALVGLLSGGSTLLFAGVLFFLYIQSRYLSFGLGSVLLLLLGALNWFLILFRRDIPLRPVTNESTALEEDPDKKGIRRLFGRILERIGYGFRVLLYNLGRFYNKIRSGMRLVFLFGAVSGALAWFNWLLQNGENRHTLQYWHLVVLVFVFVLTIVVDTYMKHLEVRDAFYSSILDNGRAGCAVTKLFTGLATIAVAICKLGLYDAKAILQYACIGIFYYVLVMLLLSFAVRTIRKELSDEPGIVLPLPFLYKASKDLSVVSFLEENTGITLRSLWSIKFIKKVLPVAFFSALFLFWISTGIVYVESYQEAAVYRFGNLQEEVLKPGLHITLPYPFEKTKVYDTRTIRKITVGYRSEVNEDNLWTEAHGDSEYKLLLGSGNELVSINLRIEYRIADLQAFLRHASQPERILEAKAYELATDRTMSQNLTNMLSVDREEFAANFRKDLETKVAQSNTGLEVVNVVMESIHPPVEVASVYQRLIGAQNEAEELILNAEASAAVALFRAESYGKITIDDAYMDYYKRVAAARTELSEFMASVEAYSECPDAYVYYKYLNALCSTYAGSKLVLVGPDVDSSRIKILYGNLS